MGHKTLRLLSAFLIIGGIITIGVAKEIKEASKPRQVQMGIMVDGHFQETDRGYIGGNPEAGREMNALTGIGVITMGVGVGGLVFSAVLASKDKTTTQKEEEV